jgi:gas vesicle protein
MRTVYACVVMGFLATLLTALFWDSARQKALVKNASESIQASRQEIEESSRDTNDAAAQQLDFQLKTAFALTDIAINAAEKWKRQHDDVVNFLALYVKRMERTEALLAELEKELVSLRKAVSNIDQKPLLKGDLIDVDSLPITDVP